MGIHVPERVSVAGYHDQTEAIAPAPSSLPSSAHRGRGQAHTELVLVVVVLPAAPWTVTTGCVARAVPLVGVLLRRPYSAASLAADAALMVTLLLVAEVSDPSVALSV